MISALWFLGVVLAVSLVSYGAGFAEGLLVGLAKGGASATRWIGEAERIIGRRL